MTAEEPLDSATDWVAEHTRQYVENGGGDFYLWRGYPTIVLTTRGRKSGALRRNALIYGKDGEDFILIASYGGRPKHPLWYLNLVADPHVTIQEKVDVVNGTATTVDLTAQEAEMAIHAARVMGLGVAGVDLLRSHRGPLVLEVNSSPGLEGIEAATGVDVAGAIIEHVAGSARSRRRAVAPASQRRA